MQIIVPIAGPSPFFKPEDYHFPKPLIEVGGVPMIQRVTENLAQTSPDAKFIFVANQNDVIKFSLGSTLELLARGCELVTLKEPCRGALCSCLMTLDILDEDGAVIIANGDQVIDVDLSKVIECFQEAEADAGVVIFDSVHPRWSYVKTDSAELVIQSAEKQVISRNAVAGFYYFKKASFFVEAAKRCIISDVSVAGQFFISSSLNELILAGLKVATFKIDSDRFHSFYSPAKILEFEERGSTADEISQNVVNVVIPAAGEGSRFRAAGYQKPKPFIDVLGMSMVEHVLQNIRPKQAKVHLLLRSEHIEAEPTTISAFRSNGYTVRSVEKLTEGTACTILLHRAAIDNHSPLLVANSDQLVDFDVNAFLKDSLDRNLDGSIVVFRDAHRDPKWSFAKTDFRGFVTEVAEKQPISDLATVGIYYFRRGSDFVDSAIDMIARNDRVNGEFYTCPVYQYMIAAGAKIGVFEVSESDMHGLGTPVDLDIYLAKVASAASTIS